MSETISALPFSFWVVVALLVGGGWWCSKKIDSGLGLPMLAVLGTIAAWYPGDAFYNDYTGHFQAEFLPATLEMAWWEVAWFLVAFLFLAPVVHRNFNKLYLDWSSRAAFLLKFGADDSLLQRQITKIFYGCLGVFIILVAIAYTRLQDEILYYFFPFLGERMDPWGRPRVGRDFDSLLSVAGSVQLFVACSFGVVAALGRKISLWLPALLCTLLTWPYFIFDRSRNGMLMVVVPATLAWIFVRLRTPVIVKIVLVAAAFYVIQTWLAFVLSNRNDGQISDSLRQKGISAVEMQQVHQEGLDMLEELCWINTFIEDGSYRVNWGKSYLAELVNPIPRGLWPEKPMVGIDYAIARGYATNSIDAEDAGVHATISTGMIGQGVVNFGRILGPVAAALLMSMWTAILARLDLTGDRLGRIPLFALGLVITFNLGRDITFLNLYTFVFGGMLVWLLDRQHGTWFRTPPALPARPIPAPRLLNPVRRVHRIRKSLLPKARRTRSPAA